jgi:hypothetical protein
VSRCSGARRRAALARALSGLALACAVLPACVAEPVPQVRPAPGPLQPFAALPARFDLVLRLDLERLRNELGGPLLRRVLLATLLSDADTPANALLGAALERADLSLIGVELGPSLASADKVVALRGHFSSIDLGPHWAPVSAEESAIEAFDCDLSQARGALTRLYRLEDELVVFAPRSQAAEVERRLARGGPEGLHPPDRGVVSLALRPAAFVASYLGRYPRLASFLGSARAASAYADPDSSGLAAALEIEFESSAAAAEASEVFTQLLREIGARGCALGDLASATTSAYTERVVSLEAKVDRSRVGRLYGCLLNGACCPEPPAPVSSATTPAAP